MITIIVTPPACNIRRTVNIFQQASFSGVRLLQRLFIIVACGALTASSSLADPQTTFVFPIQAVGATAQVLPVTVTIQTAGTLGAIQVLTQGVPNLDFTGSTPGTCVVSGTYFSGSCTVNISFNPKISRLTHRCDRPIGSKW
jgi:hypothetical protein